MQMQEFKGIYQNLLTFNGKFGDIIGYDGGAHSNCWQHKPDYQVETPFDLLKIIKNYKKI